MDTQVKVTGNPKPFGIIGLVLSIFSCVFSFIPCVGTYAIGPALLALIFSTIAFFSLKSLSQPKSMPLAGMIVSVAAISMGTYQYIKYQDIFKVKKELEQSLDKELNKKIIDSLGHAIEHKIKTDSINAAKKDTIQW